jgi:hypothetical protein
MVWIDTGDRGALGYRDFRNENGDVGARAISPVDVTRSSVMGDADV